MPALVDAAGLLALIVAFCVCWGLLYAYRYSIGAALAGLARLLISVHISVPHVLDIHPLAFLAHALTGLNHSVESALSAGVTASQSGAAYLWSGTASLAEWVADELAGLGADTLGALRRIGEGAIPALRRWAVKNIRRIARQVAAAAVAGALALLHKLTRRFNALVHKLTAIEHKLSSWFGLTRKQLRALLRKLNALGWLGAFAGVLALGRAIFRRLHLGWLLQYRTLAAFGLAVLAKLGLSWLRCDRVGRVGRGVCSADDSVLNGLLDSLVAILGTVSVVEFIRDAQAVEDEALEALHLFIRELPG